MQRALDLAARGRGRTSPNPMVGCVVVRNGCTIGEGYHEKAGLPHAEVNALRSVGDARGATVYVSLEPCCHHGRTPPCVDLLIERRLARVVVAMEDPNPLVRGQGIRKLREAGIVVDVGMLEDDARRLNEFFVKFITTGRPFVIAKCAMSLDGKIATRQGDSRWVTAEAARRRVHQLRDAVDVIMVGSGTILSDDPSLTTRLEDRRGKDPIRLIVDDGSRLDTSRRVFRLDSEAPTWVAVPEGHDFSGADRTLHIAPGPFGLDLKALMSQLGREELTSVLIEGGGTTLAAAFEAGIVDKLMFFVAPKIVGGRDAPTPVEGDGVSEMSAALPLRDLRAEPIGEDILLEAYVEH